MAEKTTKAFTIDRDVHQKAKEEYHNMSGRINDLIKEDLSALDDNKNQELERIKKQIAEAEKEIKDLMKSLQKEKDRKERLKNKSKRIEKKIKKNQAEKEAKEDFFSSQFEKVERKLTDKEYHGLDPDEMVEKFLDQFGQGIWIKFENKVESDLSRSEFRSEFKDFCTGQLQ